MYSLCSRQYSEQRVKLAAGRGPLAGRVCDARRYGSVTMRHNKFVQLFIKTWYIYAQGNTSGVLLSSGGGCYLKRMVELWTNFRNETTLLVHFLC